MRKSINALKSFKWYVVRLALFTKVEKINEPNRFVCVQFKFAQSWKILTSWRKGKKRLRLHNISRAFTRGLNWIRPGLCLLILIQFPRWKIRQKRRTSRNFIRGTFWHNNISYHRSIKQRNATRKTYAKNSKDILHTSHNFTIASCFVWIIKPLTHLIVVI